MARVIKILILLAVVSGGVVGGYFWLQAREPDDGGLEFIPVTRGSITEKAVAVGQIEPRVKFHVKSKISGIVQRCLIEVGDRVEPGDPLFEIVPDPTPIELVEAERRVDSARSAHRRARADWERTSELARQGILSSNELDAAKESFEQTRIEVASAEDNLKLIREGRITDRGREMESIIRAPAGGIVLLRNVDPGDPVVPLTTFQAGTELATVADMSDLIFKGTVDEIDVGKLAPGVTARLKIGALPEALVTGMLSRIAPQAREEDGARLFDVEIELDPVSDVVLRAGYSANADLVIREKTDILLVPERLVLFEDDGASTFVELPPELPGGEPVKIEVETGLSDGLNIEVVNGLEENDEVVQRPPREILG
jgi:HlyD family secretion protein